MGVSAAVHPADPNLKAYGLGKLDDVSAESVSKHLESCSDCQRRVAELLSDEFLGRPQNANVGSDKSAAEWSPSGLSSTEGVRGPVVPPPSVDTLPPELVDHRDYEIVRELGRGGMGVVYLVRNKLMGRLEVLKVVGGHLVERPGVRDRFLREVQSAAKLQHKNIVAAYSAMRFGESIILAMEYVEGEDLAKLVKSRGPLPVAHACYFIHQAALGLQHAHERGMVHRDIKPANLIFASEGKKSIVKVLDFGLAKVSSEGETDSALTREGQMLGTPDFIAPEQIRDAQSADIRADIYSLGCTLYYLLTGGPPFRGDHLWDVYQAHFSMEAGPLNLVRPGVSVELAAVVAKMMAKKPPRRFQTPGEVAKALTPFFSPVTRAQTGSNPEVLRADQPSLMRDPAQSAAPQPVTRPPAPTPNRAPPPKPDREVVAWESLVDLKETEPLAAPLRPRPFAAPATQRRIPWVWPALAASVVFAGLVAAMFFRGTDGPPTGRRLTNASGEGQSPTVNAVQPSAEARNQNARRRTNDAFEPPDVSRPGVPADAQLFSGKRYKIFNEHLTWNQARSKCRALGGRLAIVKDDSENEFVRSLLSFARIDLAWLGATDEVREGQWVWVDGSPMLYSNWANGQPTNNGGRGPENFLTISASDGKWNDLYDDGTDQLVPVIVCQWDDHASTNAVRRGAMSTKSASPGGKGVSGQTSINSLSMTIVLFEPGRLELNAVAWFNANSGGDTRPVGQKTHLAALHCILQSQTNPGMNRQRTRAR